MPIELVKLAGSRDLSRFIKVPGLLRRNDPFWVHPLTFERKIFLDPLKNPFFETADVEFYMALADGKPAGRIALIEDKAYNEFHNERIGFFGMFECVENYKIAELLLDKAHSWSRERKFDSLRGPMNLSTNHECGLLVEGFDSEPTFGMPYNPAFYKDFFERWGLLKAKDLLSFKLKLDQIPEYLSRAANKVRRRNRFKLRRLEISRFESEVQIIWEIYNSAWSRNWGFTPMSESEFRFAAKEMKKIVNPRYCFIAEIDGQPAGFSLTIPDINQALKPVKGNLLPFGWLKFLYRMRRIDFWRVLTLGVKKEYQRMGIDVLMYHDTFQEFLDNKVPYCEMSWILEDNEPMLMPLHRLGGYVYKRHRIYEIT